MKRNVLNSPHLTELKRKKRKGLIKKALIYSFLFLVIFVGLGRLSEWDKMNIKDIKVSGSKVANANMIKEITEKEIAGYYFWLYPKTNFLFYPKGRIENKLRNEFKVLKDISMRAESTETLEISVSERTPKYTWCGEGFPVESFDLKCYFMDTDGYIFSIAPYFSGDVYFKFFGRLEEDKENPVGLYFLPESFENIISFLDALEKIDLQPVSLLIRDEDKMEIYLSSNSVLPNSPKIIIERDFDKEIITENLQTALATDPLQTDFKNKYSSLIYIDLSFGNKVYYKFK